MYGFEKVLILVYILVQMVEVSRTRESFEHQWVYRQELVLLKASDVQQRAIHDVRTRLDQDILIRWIECSKYSRVWHSCESVVMEIVVKVKI